MQETWVWSLVWEDPTSHGVTEPMHIYWSTWALGPVLHNKKSHWCQAYYVRLLQCLIELLKEHSKYSEAYLVIYLWMEIRCPMACNQEIMHTVYLLSCFSHVWLSATLWTSLLCPWDSPGMNTGVGFDFLLQGIPQPRDRICFSYISSIGRRVLYH